MEDISSDNSRCATFFSQEPQKHITRLFNAENIPEKTIQESDIVRKMLWHEYPGHTPPHSIQPQRYVPQTLQSPENWKDAGRGKPFIDASLPLISYDNGRGRGVQSPIVANWGRGIERPDLRNYEYHVRGRGQFSSTSSVSASTSYDHGRGRGAWSPMVANWGRGVGTPSSSYQGRGVRYQGYQGRGVGDQGRGVGDQGRGVRYQGYQGRGVGDQGRGRGTNFSGFQGRGRVGHHNSVWIPRRSEHKDKSSSSMPESDGAQ